MNTSNLAPTETVFSQYQRKYGFGWCILRIRELNVYYTCKKSRMITTYRMQEYGFEKELTNKLVGLERPEMQCETKIIEHITLPCVWVVSSGLTAWSILGLNLTMMTHT